MTKPSHRFWQRFRTIALPYWFSEEKRIARGLLALLVILQLGQVAFNVLLNEQSGEFTSALAARDAPRFWRSIYQCLVFLVIAVPIYALYYYVRDKLGIVWRRWLTTTILEKYFRDRAYYRLNSNAKIDNPDQRICEDVNTFTQKSLYFLLIVMGALIQLVAFSGVLWSISKPLVMRLLESVNLKYVAERCGSLDTEMDWAKVLSVGEQQRLAVARVLLANPRFAMLDEATSALDVTNEERLYRRLRETETTLVSVSHRATILKYHHHVLELLGDGGWKLHPAKSYSFRG